MEPFKTLLPLELTALMFDLSGPPMDEEDELAASLACEAAVSKEGYSKTSVSWELNLMLPWKGK